MGKTKIPRELTHVGNTARDVSELIRLLALVAAGDEVPARYVLSSVEQAEKILEEGPPTYRKALDEVRALREERRQVIEMLHSKSVTMTVYPDGVSRDGSADEEQAEIVVIPGLLGRDDQGEVVDLAEVQARLVRVTEGEVKPEVYGLADLEQALELLAATGDRRYEDEEGEGEVASRGAEPPEAQPASSGGVSSEARKPTKPRTKFVQTERGRRQRAVRRLKSAVAVLSKEDFALWGVDGIPAVIAILGRAVDRIEKGKPADRFSPGAKVQIVEKHVPSYDGVLTAEELGGLTVAAAAGGKMVRCRLPSGDNLMIPATHLALRAAPPPSP